MAFQIRLDTGFIKALNELRDTDSWWDKLRNDPDGDVFIAVRDQGINAYVAGRSIARINWTGHRLQLLVHPKFLAVTASSARVNLLASTPSKVRGVIIRNEREYAEHFKLVKAAARLFADAEREAENAIAFRCSNVIDMEVAFNGEADNDGEGANCEPGRVDLVSVDRDGKLTLIEVKLYSNAQLHCNGVPDLCDQLGKYEIWATRNRDSIISAYRAVRKYREQLGLPLGQLPETITGLHTIPRLLVLGFGKRDLPDLNNMSEAIRKALSQQNPVVNVEIEPIGSASSVRGAHLQN